MRSKTAVWVAVAAAVLLIPAGVQAQQAGQPQEPQQARQGAEGLQLVYEREVYTYPGQDRRDPFRALTDADELGPRFESLTLKAIIYSTGRGNSLALLTDAEGRVHRARVGDVVGNSQVIEIAPLRVVLAVENFGTIRQETLELPRTRGSNP